MTDIVVTDRYSVFGPPNGCKGHCEGTGWVPVCPPLGDSRRTFWAPRLGCNVTSTFPGPWKDKDDESRALQDAWRAAEAVKPSDDGTHFVRCPSCSEASCGHCGEPNVDGHSCVPSWMKGGVKP